MIVKVRYKTDAKKEDIHHWRVIVDGFEYNASNVTITVPSWTSNDFIEGVGEKWHIGCEPTEIKWENEKCILF